MTDDKEREQELIESIREDACDEALEDRREQAMAAIREMNRSDLFNKVIDPDYAKERSMRLRVSRDGSSVSPFTKELRTSMITGSQLMAVSEFNDLARLASEIGAYGCCLMLTSFSNILLSAAPSKQGALIKLMNTEFSIKKVGVSSGAKDFLGRGQDGGG